MSRRPGLSWLPSLMLPSLLLLAAIDYTAWAYWLDRVPTA